MDVRVHTGAEAHREAEAAGQPATEIDLRMAVRVKGVDTRPEPRFQLPLCLPHPGEDHTPGRDPRALYPAELAQGDDVRPGAECPDPVEERERAVRFHVIGKEERDA